MSVSTDAIRAVEIAVEVALPQLVTKHHVALLNRSPVPIPLEMVPVAEWVRLMTSVIAPPLVSDWRAEKADVVAMLLEVACEV